MTKPLSPPPCANCGALPAAGARFCRACGTALTEAADVASTDRSFSTRATDASAPPPAMPRASAARYGPWGGAALLLLVAVAYLSVSEAAVSEGASVDGSTSGPSAVDAPFASSGARPGGAPPDISSMSPRERAGRLHDRIMRYVAEGKTDSAQFFAPMAMASFAALGPELDTGARYDFGRVAAETGSLDVAAAQSDTILQGSATHLLGLALRARTAEARGDAAGAVAAWRAFSAAQDAERAKKLPEYQTHAADLDQAATQAGRGR